MKKFLCIMFTMILLGSLLIIPISAADNEYVIPAGEYFLNYTLSDFTSLSGKSFYFDFTANGYSFNEFAFYLSSSQGGLVFRFAGDLPQYIYKNNVGYIYDGLDFRNFIIHSDFVTNDNFFYQWFMSNTTRLDSPEPELDPSDSVLAVFSALTSWFTQSFTSIIPMFFVDGRLTVLGFIFILPLAITVAFCLLHFLIASFLFRR